MSTITMAFSIVPIVSMVFLKPIKSLDILETLKRLRSKLLGPGKIPVEKLLFDTFVRLKEGLIAS